MQTKIILGAVCGALALPAVAGAHTTVSPTEAPSGGYAKLDFRVPHGCDGEPTNRLTVRIPEGVVSVKPQVVAGWEIETKQGKYAKPVELHGEQLTEGVREVTWRGGSLDDSHLQEFGLSVRLPEGEEGTKVVFPAVQHCPGGKAERWIQTAAEGESADDLDYPAPFVTLTAAEGGHGSGGDSEEGAGNAGAAAEAVDAVPAAATGGSGDGTTLAVVALVVGGLGLVAGVAGLTAARRARPTA